MAWNMIPPSDGELEELIEKDAMNDQDVGDLVDIWYEPAHKEAKGWRGPAKIASINFETGENHINVRYQGRTLERRPQEVRVHIPYLVFLVS